MMKLAIASGKGGTGKTTLSTALAQAADRPAIYMDCDVEEPNGALFLRPEIIEEKPVTVKVPKIDPDLCNGCGKCSSFCAFNALITLKDTAMIFPELCHSCGGCAEICPSGAITETEKTIGSITVGQTGKIKTLEGVLDIGHTMAPPVIKAVKSEVSDDSLIIIDCPPGNSCPLVAAVKDADYVILVTEPTPFGLHDLKLAVNTLRDLKRNFGVVINRYGTGDDRVDIYCEAEKIEILLKIPESRTIAESYSRGETIIEAEPKWKNILQDLIKELESR